MKKDDYLICINGNSNNAKEGSIAQVRSNIVKTTGSCFSLLNPSVDINWIKPITYDGSVAEQNDGEYFAKYFRIATEEELRSAGIIIDFVPLIFN